MKKTTITVRCKVNIPVEKTWLYWTVPEHITCWNFASDDWQSPRAVNDLKAGGRFSYRMEAKDGSNGFDFAGIYREVRLRRSIAYTLGDGRKVEVSFKKHRGATEIREKFEPENEFSLDHQRTGWQAILDNFRKYAESAG